MIFYKLIGYNAATGQYINPSSGEVENLPAPQFVIADSTPANYESFDAPENWSKYASNMVGSIYGLRDYLSIRWEIYTRIEAICGADYANWDSLSSEQQNVALIWSNIRIVNAQGIVFYITKCGGQDAANKYISNFLENSNVARVQRYSSDFTIYGYTYLGKTQGLKAESYARADFLDTTYVDRGVMFKSEDGIDGIGDWISGINGYSTTGLKPRIVNGEFTLMYGMDATTFCDMLITILNDGEY